MLKAFLAPLLVTVLGQNTLAFSATSAVDEQKLRFQVARQGLQMYYIHMRHFPSTDESLESLWTNPGNDKWQGPYVLEDKIAADQWGTPVRYQADGESCVLSSAGPDRQFGTRDDIALTIAKPEERNPPKASDQVYLDVVLVEPKGDQVPALRSVDPEKWGMNGLALAIYRAPFDDFNIARLAAISRTYSALGLLAPHRKAASSAIGGRPFKVEATVLMNDQVQLKIAQDVVDFACSQGGYCRSDALLHLRDGKPAAVSVQAKHPEDPAYKLMILTPHIIRSAADLGRLLQHKQDLADRAKAQ